MGQYKKRKATVSAHLKNFTSLFRGNHKKSNGWVKLTLHIFEYYNVQLKSLHVRKADLPKFGENR